jgi:putative copper export protein/mono/diheme cytochrome c family protein
VERRSNLGDIPHRNRDHFVAALPAADRRAQLMIPLDIVVASLRGLHLIALVSAFGTLTAIAMIPTTTKTSAYLHTALRRVVRLSVVSALITGIAWLATESAAIAGTDTITATLSAIPVVAFQTQYGQWFTTRCVLLLILLLTPLLRRTGLIAALILAGGALTIQPIVGHAGAVGGAVGTELIVSETLHLLAAGAWLGGLLPLFLAVSVLPHQAAASACRNFTPVGLSAVLILAGTAVVQVSELMGGLPGLFGTTYGHVALIKVAIFLALLTLAALNRLVLTEHLAHSTSGVTQRHMRLSIALEMLLGAAVVVTAGFLASLTPGTHEQPVWPFPWRPSLFAFHDPLLAPEVITATLAVAIALALIVTASLWHRARWAVLALGAVILAFALPHLDLLFIEAYPTSFFTSPTEFAATAIVHGARLFATNCVACHGDDARGDGLKAKSLPIPPADLTAEHFWAHSDGELYWYISHGFEAPDGGTAMPGFSATLSTEAIWDLIDYLRANNGGASMRATGTWSHPLPVPQFDVRCADKRTLDLDDIRGKPIHIIAASDGEQTVPLANVTTISVVRSHTATPAAGDCVTSEPETWTAFAILLGQSPDTLDGWQIVVDQNALLRAAWHPGQPGDWTNPQALITRIRDITRHPLAVDLPGAHVHIH